MRKPIIEKISMLPFGMLNAFLVMEGGRAMLVDTGLPGAERKVDNALRKHGLTWSDLGLVVLTHGHIDHAGAAVAIRARAAAPLLAHRDEAAYCGGAAPLLRPTGPFGRLFRTTGAIEASFAYFTPDVIMSEDELDLSEFGFSGRLIHTPGHTPGSISLMLPSGDVIAGDLAASGILLGGIMLRNRPKRPPFEERPREAARSLRRLLDCGGARFHLGHGGPLSARRIRAHVVHLETLSA